MLHQFPERILAIPFGSTKDKAVSALHPKAGAGFEHMLYEYASSGILTGTYQLEVCRVVVRMFVGCFQIQLPGFEHRLYEYAS
jgi:hypothetical protein